MFISPYRWDASSAFSKRKKNVFSQSEMHCTPRNEIFFCVLRRSSQTIYEPLNTFLPIKLLECVALYSKFKADFPSWCHRQVSLGVGRRWDSLVFESCVPFVALLHSIVAIFCVSRCNCHCRSVQFIFCTLQLCHDKGYCRECALTLIWCRYASGMWWGVDVRVSWHNVHIFTSHFLLLNFNWLCGGAPH